MARRKEEEGGGVPEWMCTFGDMMSLLLCFFIMLFAISTITEIRFFALADTLQQDFTGFLGSSKTRTKSDKTTTIPSTSAAKNRRISALLGGQPTPGPRGESDEVHTILLDGNTIKGGLIRFAPGRDELTEQAKNDLRATLPILLGSPQKIMVRGHTDPAEDIGIFSQETDLAFSRALSVVDYLVSLGLQQDFFEIDLADSTSLPAPILLPPGTNPQFLGASVEIILLNQTLRSLSE